MSSWKCLGAGPIVGLLLLVANGCAHNVSQHAHTGEDGKLKGAEEIELEDGEGKAKDIVSYPGGDRVDWKKIEVPSNGVLRLKLKWKPPRPGLDLAFNVYNPYRRRVARAKPTPRRRKRSKTVKIANAEPGTYYVQIYAPRRKDAGDYRLYARFKPSTAVETVDLKKVLAELPGPPPLPAIPEKTETPPATPETTETTPETATEPAVQTMKAKIVNVQMSSSGKVIITLNRGENRGVAAGWAGVILRGTSANPLTGGDFKILKVTRNKAIAKVPLSVDQVAANRYVLLTPTP